MTRFALLGALLAGALTLMPITRARAQSEPAFPTLTVTGQGSAFVRPDELRISFAVITQGATVGEALSENSRLANRVIEALKREGVEEKDIQTTDFSIFPRYSNERKGDQPPAIVGYTVQNQVRVKTADLESAGELIEAGVSAGANSVSGIQFTASDEAGLYDQAIAKAASDARRKANALAAAAGVRIVRVVSIDLEPSFSQMPRPMYAAREMAMADGAPPIEPGEVQSQATVRIVFQISEG